MTVAVSSGEIEIAGSVPTQAHHDTLITIASQAFGLVNVVDHLEVSGLEPAVAGADDRVAALRQFVGAFAGTETALAVLSDETLNVAICVADQVTANLFIGLARVLSDALPVTLDVTLAEPPLDTQVASLQDKLDALADVIAATVTFPPGSSDLGTTARTTLNVVAEVIQHHPRPVVEIAGHTDDLGDPAANLTLSAFRAQAIEAYLVSVGVDAARLMSRGVGDTEPIADNTTPEGRAQNRRVVFTVLEGF